MYESTAVMTDGTTFSSAMDSTADRSYLQFPLHSDMSAAAPPGSASYGTQTAAFSGIQHTPGPPVSGVGSSAAFSKRPREPDRPATQDPGLSSHMMDISAWEAKRLKLDPFQPTPGTSNNSNVYSQFYKADPQQSLAFAQQAFDVRAPQGTQLEQLQERYRATGGGTTSPFQTGSHLPLDTSFPSVQSTTTSTTSPLVYSSSPVPTHQSSHNSAPYFGSPSQRVEWPSASGGGDSLPPFGCGLSGTQPRMFTLPSPPKSASAGGLGPFGCSSSLAFPKPMSNECDPVPSIPQRREATSMVDLKQQQQFALQQYQQQQQQAVQQMQQQHQPQQQQLSYQPQHLVPSMHARQMAMDTQTTSAGQMTTTTRGMMIPTTSYVTATGSVPGGGASSPRKRISKKKKKDRDAGAQAAALSGEKIDITHLLKLPQSTAAQMLNMSQATFSKRFREANDKRWPYRRLIVLEKQLKTALSEGDKQTANSLEAAKIQLLGPCFIYKKNEDKKIH